MKWIPKKSIKENWTDDDVDEWSISETLYKLNFALNM